MIVAHELYRLQHEPAFTSISRSGLMSAARRGRVSCAQCADEKTNSPEELERTAAHNGHRRTLHPGSKRAGVMDQTFRGKCGSELPGPAIRGAGLPGRPCTFPFHFEGR